MPESHVLSKPAPAPPQRPCGHCGRALWPDITVQGRPPLLVCPSCASPRARFWHRHEGRHCPLGYPWPLHQDPGGRRFICC